MTSQSLIEQNQILIMCLQLLEILVHNIHLYTSIHKNTAKYQKDKRMLDIRQHKVKLKKTYEQILFLAVAFCDSYVFQGRRSVGQDVIVHCNKDGAILYEYLPDCLIDSFAMLSDRQILFLEPKKHKICRINLETQIITKFNHYFMSEESDRAVIDTFASTNLACVVQTGRYNDNRLFLTYYAFDQFRKQETFKLVPFFRFESVDDQWTHEMVVSKADTHSMYLWYWRRHDKFITLNYFDLKNLDLMQRPDRAYRKLIMTNSMGQLYNLPKIQCSIQNAWLLEEGKVLLQCQTDKIQKQAYSKQNIVINTFVLDLQKEHIRQTKFSFHPIYNDFLIDCYNLGQFSIFKTFFYYFNGSVQKTPYYFVQNSTQKILKNDNRSECTYKLKHLIPGYKFNTIYENQYENSKIEEFTIRQHFVVKMDMLYLSFLLHLNEDFDDDLLKDACELLDQRDM